MEQQSTSIFSKFLNFYKRHKLLSTLIIIALMVGIVGFLLLFTLFKPAEYVDLGVIQNDDITRQDINTNQSENNTSQTNDSTTDNSKNENAITEDTTVSNPSEESDNKGFHNR